MPWIQLTTSLPLPSDQRDALLASLSSLISETTGKPEKYVMVSLAEQAMRMSGEAGPAAFADIRGIGCCSHDINARIVRQRCDLLDRLLMIPPDRVYITFTDIAADHWGWNGQTFG